MRRRVPKAFSNALLGRLGESEVRALRPHLVPVVLNKGEVLGSRQGSNDDSLYFIETGVLCVNASLSDGDGVTVALAGREGVGGAEKVFGTQPVGHHLLVLIPGSAFKLEADLLRRDRPAFPAILGETERYVQVLVAQIAQSAICNRYHRERERLARWLLFAGDCAGTSRLALTHSGLAQMVGGARSLVTAALMELRERNALDYRRGVVILKRRTLAGQACECYQSVRKAVARYLAS